MKRYTITVNGTAYDVTVDEADGSAAPAAAAPAPKAAPAEQPEPVSEEAPAPQQAETPPTEEETEAERQAAFAERFGEIKFRRGDGASAQ